MILVLRKTTSRSKLTSWKQPESWNPIVEIIETIEQTETSYGLIRNLKKLSTPKYSQVIIFLRDLRQNMRN
jgi:hypothetical protein